MVVNPFLRLYEAPVETLTAVAYALVLLAALAMSWYALTRNLLALENSYQAGWKYLPPFRWTIRAVATLLVLALDCLLVAGIIGVLT